MLNHMLFNQQKPTQQKLKAKIDMALSREDFESFQKAFIEMRNLAKDDKQIRKYLFQLHNKITGGATDRMFKRGELSLEDLRITQANFQRFVVSSKENEFEALPSKSTNSNFSQ